MPIRELRGDILTSNAQTLVCPTNCVGVMGKGLARTIKDAYPTVWQQYRQDYLAGRLGLHVMPCYLVTTERQILCFPTKEHWRDPSQLAWVDDNLRRLAMHWQWWNITSLALPALGCGLGGLSFDTVKPCIYQHLAPLPLAVDLYLP